MRQMLVAALLAPLALLAGTEARAQDGGLYIVRVVPIEDGVVQLRFETLETAPETCPLVADDILLSVGPLDDEGYAMQGLIDLTTYVPEELECDPEEGPWTGAIELRLGEELPELREGLYDVYIDDSYEGTLWLESWRSMYTDDEGFVVP